MKAPKFGLLFLFLLFGTYVSAQKYVVYGYIVNAQNEPVSKAWITLENYNASSNAKGFFTLRTDILPSVLTVRHGQYNPREYFVNMPPMGQDSVFVTVALDDKGTDLEEVTITASRVIWAYPKANVHVIDFELYKEGMLLLCKDDNTYLLRIVDAGSEPIFDLPIRKHPKSFFKDCNGHMHVLYPDSTYRVNIYHDSLLSLQAPVTMEKFRQNVMPCACSAGNAQVYQYGSRYSQVIDFIMLDTLSHKVTRLYAARSRKYMRAVEEYELELAKQLKSARLNNGDGSVDQQMLLMDLERRRQEELQYLVARPTYAPAFNMRDSVIIFDHLNDSAVVFSRSGRVIRSFPIIYQHHHKWDYELIPNDEGTRIFARFNYRGMAHLMEIDLNTGGIIREVPLVTHIYPSKIEIRGNFVYYIFHHYIDYSINYVYKQRIE